MLTHPATKYQAFTPIPLPDRQWPGRTIAKAPRWLSTDLRDGNQSLIEPMDVERKQRFYDLLVRLGYKEIEVSFPSASDTDFAFVRSLIEGDKIPHDVWIQVLTPARTPLIERTIESLIGAPRAIVHLYNATAPVFREVVFNNDKAATIALAVEATRTIKHLTEAHPETDWRFEYSPEVFTGTEMDFALEICEAVKAAWQPTAEKPIIFNLPATVEMAGPNVYADQVEWFGRHISNRDRVVISVHPHNDRGTAVAAAELAVMAGADRVEGCLFGNGERTGNVDLVTLALNLYTQGIHPGVDYSNMRDVVRTVEHCNQMTVPPRHPYAGDLVFTAFSGSHQDAIKKGFAARAGQNDPLWQVPYLPIDPADLGCSYEAVIRVNSQSGKGGVAWILEQDRGLHLPRRLQIAFSRVVQTISDESGKEQTAQDIWDHFCAAYHLDGPQRVVLIDAHDEAVRGGHERIFTGRLLIDGREQILSGRGNGPISACVTALKAAGIALDVLDYHEHALGSGAESRAAAFLECRSATGEILFGVGLDEDIANAGVKAVISAANSALL